MSEKGNQSGGAVAATDSESETEKNRKKNKILAQFKWTVESEQELEKLLLDNYFDFGQVQKLFDKAIN